MDHIQKTILIVEDDSSLSRALEEILSRNNFAIYSESSGADGLSTALTLHPDLILLDLIMPGLGGLGFLNQIRKDSWGSTARIIVMTNLPSESKQQIAAGHHVAGYFLKSDTSLTEVVALISAEFNSPHE